MTFLASDTETQNYENHVSNNSSHKVVANKYTTSAHWLETLNTLQLDGTKKQLW